MKRVWDFARIVATGAPAPGATITVYNTGTLVLSTIFADDISTPKANPFTADSIGYWYFYTPDRVDVQVSGVGITTYVLGDIESSGLQTLNTLTPNTQTFAVGTAGTDFAIVSAASAHTFNIPSASAANRGLITTGAQTIAGTKTLTGVPNFAGAPTYNPGTSSGATAIASGRITTNVTPVASVAPGPTNLITYTLLANTLSTNGMGIWITIGGGNSANANAKTLTFNFGATAITIFGPAVLPSINWLIRVLILRSGPTAQYLAGHYALSSGASGQFNAFPAETLSANSVIKCTGTGATNGDLQQNFLLVEAVGA